jgi:hypothetical protein
MAKASLTPMGNCADSQGLAQCHEPVYGHP